MPVTFLVAPAWSIVFSILQVDPKEDYATANAFTVSSTSDFLLDTNELAAGLIY